MNCLVILKKLLLFFKLRCSGLQQSWKEWLIRKIPIEERERIFITINQDNVVKTIKEYHVARLFPWPKVTKRSQVLHRTGLFNFSKIIYKLLYPNTEPWQIFSQLRDRSLVSLKTSVQELPRAITHPLTQSIEAIIPIIPTYLTRYFPTDNNLQQAAQLIKDTISSSTAHLKQEWSYSIRQAILNSDLIEQLRSNIINRLRERLNKEEQTFKFTHNTPLLPDGTKFVYRHERLTFVVVEQKPSLRTVAFESSFILYKARQFSPPDSPIFKKSQEETNFYLSFPYIVFVLAFNNDQLCGFYCFYNNKPLKTLDDMLFLTNLPNTSVNGYVCLHAPIPKEGTPLTSVVEQAIGHFWQSSFNGDISDNYWYMAQRDQRLADIGVWEAISQTNPSFWLDVNWNRAQPLRTLIDNTINNFGHEMVRNLSAYFEQLVAAQIETSITQTTASIMANCKMPEITWDSLISRKLNGFLTNLSQTIISYIVNELQAKSTNCETSSLDLIIQELSAIINRTLPEIFECYEDELISSQIITLPRLVTALESTLEEIGHEDR